MLSQLYDEAKKLLFAVGSALPNAQHGLHRRDSAGIKLQPTPSPEETTIDIPTVPVKLDGETLCRVRGVSAYPANSVLEME